MPLERVSDDDLVLSGDPEDFGRFYDRYAEALLGYFMRRTGDPEIAADLTAETFAAALVARRRFRRGATPAIAWLFGIAQHKLADQRRNGHAEDRMRRRLGMEPVPLLSEDVEVIRWLGDEVAAQLVDRLPADQRHVVREHVIEERAYAEIAREEQTSQAAIRQRVHRALRALRDHLELHA